MSFHFAYLYFYEPLGVFPNLIYENDCWILFCPPAFTTWFVFHCVNKQNKWLRGEMWKTVRNYYSDTLFALFDRGQWRVTGMMADRGECVSDQNLTWCSFSLISCWRDKATACFMESSAETAIRRWLVSIMWARSSFNWRQTQTHRGEVRWMIQLVLTHMRNKLWSSVIRFDALWWWRYVLMRWDDVKLVCEEETQTAEETGQVATLGNCNARWTP